MRSFKTIYIISINTMKQLLQGKILLNTLFLTIALFLITFVATKFTHGVPHKISLDVGLALLSMSSIIIAISLGVGLISNEIESRTLYVILARAVSRYEFLIGKILGLTLILAINMIILCLATALILTFLGGSISPMIIWCMVFIMLEAILVLNITVFFSLITNKVLTIILTVIIWCLGYIAYSVIDSPFVTHVFLLKELLEVYTFIFPAFIKFNLKDYVLYENDVSMNYIFNTIGYFKLYAASLLVLSCLVFRNKNLD